MASAIVRRLLIAVALLALGLLASLGSDAGSALEEIALYAHTTG